VAKARGGEGLASAVRYNYFTGTNELAVPFFNSGEATISLGNRNFVLKQRSRYPFEGSVSFEVLRVSAPSVVRLRLAAPSFTGNHKVSVNGRPVAFKKENGFIAFDVPLHKGTEINLTFTLDTGAEAMVNKRYPRPGFYTLYYGPLLLGYAGKGELSLDRQPKLVKVSDTDWTVAGTDIHLSPVYHLLNPEVRRETGYARQVLFPIGQQ
jgi:DUF1680 family protein